MAASVASKRVSNIDVVALLDTAPVGGAVLVCGLAAMMDGFDIQAKAFVPGAGRGVVIFSAGLSGIMIGQFLFTPLADRFGRKADRRRHPGGTTPWGSAGWARSWGRCWGGC
jgi:MFS family permease